MKELAVAMKMCAGTLKVAIELEEKKNTRLFSLKEGEDFSMELWTKLALILGLLHFAEKCLGIATTIMAYRGLCKRQRNNWRSMAVCVHKRRKRLSPKHQQAKSLLALLDYKIKTLHEKQGGSRCSVSDKERERLHGSKMIKLEDE